jgi:hypothetical protein
MASEEKRQEIDHRTIKLIVGVIAISLAILTSVFAENAIPSISASYHQGGWSQSIFIGFLFAIAAFMLAYNGASPREMVLSKIAAIAALGVALYPCEYEGYTPVPYIHGASAAVMFLILVYFCREFYKRAREKEKKFPRAKRRAYIYAVCGTIILLAMLVLAFDHFSGNTLSDPHMPRLIFYGEAVGLIAFGISWLTASRTLGFLTDSGEHFIPMRGVNPK